jgi:hypothetical protein
MTALSPLLGLKTHWLSVSVFIPAFTTSTMVAAAWAPLEVSEPTKGRWQSQLQQQQQVSRFTDDSGFTVDLPAGWITYDYANTGPDAK